MTSNSSSNWTNQSFLGKSCDLAAKNQSLDTRTVIVFSVLSSLVLLISALSNGFLCYLLIRFKQLRTVNNIQVADLVIVNLFHLTIKGPPFLSSVVLGVDINRGRSWVFFMFVLHIYLSYITLTTMFMMLLDRYLTIRYPFKHKSTKNTKTVLVAICAKWLLSWVPILIICGPLYRIGLGGCPASYYVAVYTKEPIFQIGRYFTGPPVIFASICLYIMSRHKLRQSKNNLTVPELLKQRTTDLKNEKALTTIFLTVASFCFCYASSFVIIAATFRPFESLRLQLFVVYTLLFIPGAVNPLIYFIRVECFKAVIKEQCGCICFNGQTQNPPESGAPRAFPLENENHTSDIQKLSFNGQDVEELRVISVEEQGRTSSKDVQIQYKIAGAAEGSVHTVTPVRSVSDRSRRHNASQV